MGRVHLSLSRAICNTTQVDTDLSAALPCLSAPAIRAALGFEGKVCSQRQGLYLFCAVHFTLRFRKVKESIVEL